MKILVQLVNHDTNSYIRYKVNTRNPLKAIEYVKQMAMKKKWISKRTRDVGTWSARWDSQYEDLTNPKKTWAKQYLRMYCQKTYDSDQ